MKKFFILACVSVALFFAFNTTTNAASYTTGKQNIISINPLGLIGGLLNATFEHKLSAKNSFTVNASYWSFSSVATAFGVGASYRWYFDPFDEGKSSVNGLSVAPRLQFYQWSYSWDNAFIDDFSYSSLSLGVEVAYKWVFDDKWVVEPTFIYSFPIVKKSGYSFTDYGWGVNLGYAF